MDTPFKIIELPKMKMASFHFTNSEKPEEEAFEKLKLWAESRGLFDNPSIHQVFGRNNPKLRGYKFLVSLSDLRLTGYLTFSKNRIKMTIILWGSEDILRYCEVNENFEIIDVGVFGR